MAAPAAGALLAVFALAGPVEARPKPAPPPAPTADPARRLLEEYRDRVASEERFRQMLEGIVCGEGAPCDSWTPMAERLVRPGRIAAAVETAEAVQATYWCFLGPGCVPADTAPSHAASETLYSRGVLYVRPGLACRPPSASSQRVAAELSVRRGECPDDSATGPQPSGVYEWASVAPSPSDPRATALAGDPTNAALPQMRRMDWIAETGAALADLSTSDLGLSARDLARAELEQAVLERAFASEKDPWIACGGRPVDVPFVPLLPSSAAEATLRKAAAHLATARTELGWKLVFRTEALLHLEQGDCPAVSASLAQMRRPSPEADWLEAQIDRRWPGGCPAATP